VVEYLRGDGGRLSWEVVDAMWAETRFPRIWVDEEKLVVDAGRGKRFVGEGGAGVVVGTIVVIVDPVMLVDPVV